MEDVGDFVAFEQILTCFIFFFYNLQFGHVTGSLQTLVELLFYTSCGFMARWEKNEPSYEMTFIRILNPSHVLIGFCGGCGPRGPLHVGIEPFLR